MTCTQGNPVTNRPPWRSPTLWALVGILAVSALVRGLYLREIMDQPGFDQPAVDAGTHHYWARGLATGDWTPPPGRPDPGIPHTPFVRPPGYPYFLALIYSAMGTGPIAPRVVQMALGLVNIILAFVIGRRWYGRAVGLTWAGFMGGYWAFIHFEGELQATTLFVTLLLTLIYVLGRWSERRRWGRGQAAIAGGLIGVTALLRPNALPVAAAVALWMLVVARRRGSMRQGIASAGVMLVCCGLGVAPALVRNYMVAGEFVLVSANGGINFFIGNNEAATGLPSGTIPGVGRFADCFDYPALVTTIERQVGKRMSYSEISAHFSNRGLEYVRSHPGETLRLTAEKALLFWGPWEIANNKEIHYERVFSAVLSHLPGNFSAVLALAMVGGGVLLIDLRRRVAASAAEAESLERRRDISLLLVLTVAVLFAAILPFFVCARYRVPIVPHLLLFSAYGVVGVVRLAAARRWVVVGPMVLGGAVAYVGASTPLVPGGPDLFRWYFDRGAAYSRLGDNERALRHYEAALEDTPDVPLARMGAARVLLSQDRAEEAAEHMRYILRYVHPHAAEAHHLLARALRMQGDVDQGIIHYGESLRIKPDALPVRLDLARWLRELDRLEDAVVEYQHALVTEPDNATVLYELGLALRDVGRANEADRYWRAAARLAPERREQLALMGIVLSPEHPTGPESASTPEASTVDELEHRGDQLAAVGRTQQAIDAYRAALVIEAASPVLQYKLAEALSAAGRFEDALPHYQRALEISPEQAVVHVGLGIAYGRLDDAAAAVKHYRAATRLDPDNLSAHYNLGVVLGDGLERYSEAINALGKALTISRSAGRADLVERISERIERFRIAAAEGKPGDAK